MDDDFIVFIGKLIIACLLLIGTAAWYIDKDNADAFKIIKYGTGTSEFKTSTFIVGTTVHIYEKQPDGSLKPTVVFSLDSNKKYVIIGTRTENE